MNSTIIAALVQLLQADTTNMAGITTVEPGEVDEQNPPANAKHPVVRVAWEEDFPPEGAAGRPAVTFMHRAKFTATLLVQDNRTGDSAAKTLEDLLLRKESGVLKGLKVALIGIHGFADPTTSQTFMVQIGTTKRLRRPPRASVGAATEIFVTTWF